MPIDNANIGWLKSFSEIRREVAVDPVWAASIGTPESDLPSCGIHLAVFVEPFLGYILDGTKTVESRFSVNRCAPFGKVNRGDVILLKRAGGPVVGIVLVRTVWSYQLDVTSWKDIREKFAKSLRAQDPGFWEQRRNASYATLMSIKQVRALNPVEWEKRDRRGWVVVRSVGEASLFRDDNER